MSNILEAYDLDGGNPADAPNDGEQAISWIFTGVGDVLGDFMELVTVTLTEQVEPFFLTACILFVALYGYATIFGWVEVTSKVFTKNMSKLFLIMVLFYQWDTFLPLLTDLFFNDPAELSSEILSQAVDAIEHSEVSDTSAISILDTIALTAFGYFGKASLNLSLTSGSSIVMWFEAFVLLICIMYMVIYAVYLLMKSFLIMTVFLSLGQLFIPFMLFDFTRGMALAWWNQMVTYMFVPLFTLMLLTLVFSIGFYQLEALNLAVATGEEVQASNLMGSVIIAIIGGLMMSEVPELARSVGGGFSFNSNSLAAGAANVGRGYAGVKGMYKTVSSKFGKGNIRSNT